MSENNDHKLEENISNNNQIMGHPRGLFLLFSIELWERFSYYAMRAILVLFLTDTIINGGMGWDTKDALRLYGIFTGLSYITPLIGGWIADNYLGQRNCILIGAFCMALGQFQLAIPEGLININSIYFFYSGLALLVIGTGLFKPNISTMVGCLYQKKDFRRDSGFTIFYMGINIGALLAGIIAGTVTDNFGWKSGFFAAGLGMIISLMLQVFFAETWLRNIGKYPVASRVNSQNSTKSQPLTTAEIKHLQVILIMGLFVIVFWIGFEQAGGLMNIYTEKYINRMIGSFEIPAAWFQSLNPFFIIFLAPVIALFWVKLGKNNPNSIIKFSFSLFFLALGFCCMIGAVLEQAYSIQAKASMLWLIGAYFFHTIGELCISPVGLSLVTKLAPIKLTSLIMGTWFSFNAIASYISGIIGSYVDSFGPLVIFAGIAATTFAFGIILLIFSGTLVRWLYAQGNPVGNTDSRAQIIH